jgi:hypothetical protein
MRLSSVQRALYPSQRGKPTKEQATAGLSKAKPKQSAGQRANGYLKGFCQNRSEFNSIIQQRPMLSFNDRTYEEC